ncbi:MAG: hypothetical protein U1A27_07850 [Phycisphaerae bacterium]
MELCTAFASIFDAIGSLYATIRDLWTMIGLASIGDALYSFYTAMRGLAETISGCNFSM